jgi:hypothetical protein
MRRMRQKLFLRKVTRRLLESPLVLGELEHEKASPRTVNDVIPSLQSRRAEFAQRPVRADAA